MVAGRPIRRLLQSSKWEMVVTWMKVGAGELEKSEWVSELFGR